MMSFVKKIREFCGREILIGFKNCPDYLERLGQECDDLDKWVGVGHDKAKELWEMRPEKPKATNGCGSLVLFLLGYTTVNPVEGKMTLQRTTIQSDSVPDIDSDFDPRVRDWVKKHIVETFGADNVCSIGTYQTYRTRAVILDVARVLGLDLGEVSNVTKRIDPLKSFEDEDGEDTKVDKMEFDELCEHYEELKAYFETYPEVKRHAEILRNQVKNMGKHAGGVIISDLSLKDRIPVLYDKAQGDERQVISAWAESGSTSELGAVGLVKYDILGLNNLQVISDCVELVKKHYPDACDKVRRENIPISDQMAIEQTAVDAVGIFQLENPSTKGVIREVKMESLNDVAAVTSLIRPGPKDMGMDMAYARRKNGEPYEMPEFLRRELSETHGVLTYQEDVMRISRVLCGFTGPDANKLRKACGKKKPELMAEQREKFIKGAQPRIEAGEITAEEVEQIWNNIESFAGYAFCLGWDTVVQTPGGDRLLSELRVGDKVLTPACFGRGFANVSAVIDQGIREAYEVVFESGKRVVCTMDHRLLCEDGMLRPLSDIIGEGHKVVCEDD